ncbi:MAG: hypothetical protein FIB01_16200 [Gemmatimonadetes bacterium]|nr:hypothetical protein [Gemmatimonadota bacterium]
MAGAVSRLKLRAPPGHAVAARTRAEDAIRLAAPDDLLLVLRRLDLGRIGLRSTPAQWNARAAERVEALRRHAVHGATPGAASAEAVWFRSAAEAEALLLLELASGRIPTAWFWRLAVRGWRGAPLSRWLPRRLAEAAADPLRAVALAHALVTVAAAGRLPALSEALAEVAPPVAVPEGAGNLNVATPAGPGSHPWQPAAGGMARVHRLLARHDPAVRKSILDAIAAAGGQGPAPRWIARLRLQARAPELAAHPALLTAATAELLAVATAAGSTADIAPPEGFSPGPAGGGLPREPRSAGQRPVAATDSQPSPEAPQRPRSATVVAERARAIQPPPVAAASADFPKEAVSEEISLGAGVFLLVRPLVLMGLPDWLERRPNLVVDGFGRALFYAIAERMRIEAGDPLFATLQIEPMAVWQTSLTAWRIGLDRWLRRTARIRLSEVVRRKGWISATPERISVRFRVAAAEVRLRRHALDVDPGWVPWLGLALCYHYRDQPVVDP